MGYKKFLGPGSSEWVTRNSQEYSCRHFHRIFCERFLGICADFPQNCSLGGWCCIITSTVYILMMKIVQSIGVKIIKIKIKNFWSKLRETCSQLFSTIKNWVKNSIQFTFSNFCLSIQRTLIAYRVSLLVFNCRYHFVENIPS